MAYTIQNNIPNTTYKVVSGVVTVTAKSGYAIDGTPTIDNYDEAGLMGRVWLDLTVSSDKKTASVDLAANSVSEMYKLVLKGNTIESAAYLINNTVGNTTYEVNGDTLTVMANDGYKFETAPTAECGSGLMDRRSATGVLSDGGKVATFNLLEDDSGLSFPKNTEITVSGEVVEDAAYIINNTIQNTTYEVNGDTLTVTADSGYRFDTAPMATSGTGLLDGRSETGVLSDGGKVATFNLLSDDNGHPFSKDSEITLSGSVVEDTYTINNTIEYTTYSVSGDTLTVTANVGYKFEVAPTADNADSASPMNRRSATGVLSDGGKVATFNLLSDDNGNPFQKEYTITLRGAVVADVVYSGFYGSINVYELTNDNLKAFAAERFSKTAEDLGKYVTNLFRIFCPVGETIDAVITTGDVNTGIQAKTPKSDIVVLDFGDVTVPLHNNDLTDYNSNIQMFLPFVGFVDINTNYIGKPINLTYEVNVITGEAVVKLSTDGIIFSVYDCNVSSALIYKTSDYDIVGDTGFSSRFMYGLKPFVKVVWRQSMNAYVNNDECVRKVIGSITGFARITECDEINTSQMTTDEKQMIENQLKYGIFIN